MKNPEKFCRLLSPIGLRLGEDDQVLGVVKDGVAKAYPLRILVWHEVVNDRLGDTPVVATY